jgi:hypothetical protein
MSLIVWQSEPEHQMKKLLNYGESEDELFISRGMRLRFPGSHPLMRLGLKFWSMIHKRPAAEWACL